MTATYEVFVSKDDFKFNAAHFIAYPGFREKLHGHNYRVSVRVEGEVGADGYVVDFDEIKTAARRLCSEMNERVIVPMRSDCIEISSDEGQLTLVCEDGSRFSIPEQDCAPLPILHSSAEELAGYLCQRLADSLEAVRSRRLIAIEVGVAEAPSQEARCRLQLDGNRGRGA